MLGNGKIPPAQNFPTARLCGKLHPRGVMLSWAVAVSNEIGVVIPATTYFTASFIATASAFVV